MNRLFYPKLALNNMKKNAKFYIPYMITCIVTIAMFYIMCSLTGNEGLKKMPGRDSLDMIFSFGTGTIGVFAVIFLFYTNSFLMKRRKKELGLYNILGMEKGHIFKVLFFETVYLFIVSIIAGLAAGVLLDKMMTLTLCKLINFSVPFGFYVSRTGMFQSTALFAFIFFLILASQFIQIGRTKPIDLLHGGNMGEKEPKAKWLLALAGTVSLGVAYYISITTESPLQAIELFFIAVLLVIFGTYCLFTAGSIVLLKMLRRNKKYYYRTKHFISVSGMIYRMKQNAVGLSNICILCTMVLVMMSTTISLYIGNKDALDIRYGYDITAKIHLDSTEFDKQKIIELMEQAVEKQGRNIKKEESYLGLRFTVKNDNGVFKAEQGLYINSQSAAIFEVITEEEYRELTGENVEALGENEVYVYHEGEDLPQEIDLMEHKYQVKENLEQFPGAEDDGYIALDFYYMVVKDHAVLNDIYQKQKEGYGEAASQLCYEIGIDIDGTKEEKIVCADAVKKVVKDKNSMAQSKAIVDYDTSYVESKQGGEDDFFAAYGGFLFLGIFLGILFLMATALIIYYKQISEGYEDRERFEIMEKVGMTKAEVRESIQSQVLTIFFLPIVAATIHVAAAFPLIRRLLVLFNLQNVPLYAWCTVGTIAVFAVIYGLVYVLTARIYYKIVS